MSIVRRLSTAASMALLCSSGTVAIIQPAVAAAPVQVAYGSSAEINTFSGRVRYIVSAPEVVVFHTDEYDADAPDSRKPGAALEPRVRVRVEVVGVSGEVAATASVELVYEAPGGLLAATDTPYSTYEKTDLLISKPSAVSAGQRITGEVYFASGVAGGKVIASGSGNRQAVWRP